MTSFKFAAHSLQLRPRLGRSPRTRVAHLLAKASLASAADASKKKKEKSKDSGGAEREEVRKHD